MIESTAGANPRIVRDFMKLHGVSDAGGPEKRVGSRNFWGGKTDNRG
jgi:hypothetical protein